MASALSISLLDGIVAHAKNSGAIPDGQAAPLLERVLECRTAGEGERLIAEAEAELKAKADAAARERYEEVEGPAYARKQARLGAGTLGRFPD